MKNVPYIAGGAISLAIILIFMYFGILPKAPTLFLMALFSVVILWKKKHEFVACFVALLFLFPVLPATSFWILRGIPKVKQTMLPEGSVLAEDVEATPGQSLTPKIPDQQIYW